MTINYNSSYTETRQTHNELKYKTLNWPMIVGFSFVVFMMLATISTGGIYGVINSNTFLSIYCFTMAVALLASCCQIPLTIINHVKTPNKYRTINTTFSDDQIEIKYDNVKTRLKYSDIKKIKETANFYIIIFDCLDNGRRYVAVKKNEISCDEYAFKNFILEKKKEATL